MSIGIYKLNFSNTSKCYIGQSVNIEKRYLQHLRDMRNGSASVKMQEAFSTYGKPTLEILLECTIDELDDCEEDAISIYNSVDSGFNTYTNAYQAPNNLSGVDHPNAIFTREQLLYVADLLCNTTLTYPEISDITGVTECAINTISLMKNHSWIYEEYPEIKAALLKKQGTRNQSSRKIVSHKLSAGSVGIIYPLIEDPEGILHKISNAYAFAKERGLAPNHFQEVLNGKRKSHKGWKLP